MHKKGKDGHRDSVLSKNVFDLLFIKGIHEAAMINMRNWVIH